MRSLVLKNIRLLASALILMAAGACAGPSGAVTRPTRPPIVDQEAQPEPATITAQITHPEPRSYIDGARVVLLAGYDKTFAEVSDEEAEKSFRLLQELSIKLRKIIIVDRNISLAIINSNLLELPAREALAIIAKFHDCDIEAYSSIERFSRRYSLPN